MSTTLHWFRRDLRLRDNTALAAACRDADSVAAVFVIDPRWFAHPDFMGPHQTAFWLDSLRELHSSLADRSIPLFIVTHPDPVAAVLAAARQIHADRITLNRDDEPAQIIQDNRLIRAARRAGLTVPEFKDTVLWERDDLLTAAGNPYTVFTPYKKAWLAALAQAPPAPAALPRRPQHPIPIAPGGNPRPAFPPAVPSPIPAGESGAQKLLSHFLAHHLASYAHDRDYPARDATSHLSAHLAAGTISPRQILTALARHSAFRPSHSAFLAQLIWREFYRQVLFHRPDTVTQPFRRAYARLPWTNHPSRLAAWQQGRTGYPIVDAALQQLLTTGFMHNRLRMIVAMFLTKHLDCHWALGERFFRQHLVDYDQANNVGGWQWSASTGTDAAPYFRLMNPTLQSQRFDPAGDFIRRHLPALARVPLPHLHHPWTMPLDLQRQSRCVLGEDYPQPIVDHATARTRALAKFHRR